MQGQIYKTYEYTLADGERVSINRLGTFVSCLAATAGFDLQMDNGDFGEFEAGLTYDAPEGQVFRSVALVNTSGASNVIKLAVGFGRVTDARLTISGELKVNDASPDKWTVNVAATVGAGATYGLLGAYPNRCEAFICNNGSGPVYLQRDNNSAERGIKLNPGQTFIMRSTDSIYAYNPGASSVELMASWTEWS